MLDLRTPRTAGPSDRHNIETDRIFQQPVLLEIRYGQPRQASLLLLIDRLDRMPCIL